MISQLFGLTSLNAPFQRVRQALDSDEVDAGLTLTRHTGQLDGIDPAHGIFRLGSLGISGDGAGEQDGVDGAFGHIGLHDREGFGTKRRRFKHRRFHICGRADDHDFGVECLDRQQVQNDP